MIRLFLLIWVIIGLFGCAGSITSSTKLTDGDIEKFIKTYKKLREVAPDLANNPNSQGEAGFKKFEGVIKEGGFKDYKEFMIVTATMAWAFNIAQGELGLETFGNMQSDGERQMMEQINNPDVPEATKQELREGLKKMRAEYAKNKKWADIVMGGVKPLTNDDNLALIKKHRKELEDVFRGVKLEQ